MTVHHDTMFGCKRLSSSEDITEAQNLGHMDMLMRTYTPLPQLCYQGEGSVTYIYNISSWRPRCCAGACLVAVYKNTDYSDKIKKRIQLYAAFPHECYRHNFSHFLLSDFYM